MKTKTDGMTSALSPKSQMMTTKTPKTNKKLWGKCFGHFPRLLLNMKILKITWLDACHYPDQTGIISVILEKARLREVIDIGYLLGEDDQRVVLASVKKEGGRFNKITAIPKNSIIKQDTLEETGD
jgi:hypothetical protein